MNELGGRVFITSVLPTQEQVQQASADILSPPREDTTKNNADQKVVVQCCPLCCLSMVTTNRLPMLYITISYLLKHFSSRLFNVVPLDYLVRYFGTISSTPFAPIHCGLAYDTLAFFRPYQLTLQKIDDFPTVIQNKENVNQCFMRYRVKITTREPRANVWEPMANVLHEDDFLKTSKKDCGGAEFCLQCSLDTTTNETPLELYVKKSGQNVSWQFVSRLLVWSQLQHYRYYLPPTICLISNNRM